MTHRRGCTNGINSDGSLMNVGNRIWDPNEGGRPSIRLFPKYSTGDAMKAALALDDDELDKPSARDERFGKRKSSKQSDQLNRVLHAMDENQHIDKYQNAVVNDFDKPSVRDDRIGTWTSSKQSDQLSREPRAIDEGHDFGRKHTHLEEDFDEPSARDERSSKRKSNKQADQLSREQRVVDECHDFFKKQYDLADGLDRPRVGRGSRRESSTQSGQLSREQNALDEYLEFDKKHNYLVAKPAESQGVSGDRDRRSVSPMKAAPGAPAVDDKEARKSLVKKERPVEARAESLAQGHQSLEHTSALHVKRRSCMACGEAIQGHDFEIFFDHPYHPSCVRCSDCLRKITGDVWKGESGDNLRCNDCHQRSRPTCVACGERIQSNRILRINGQPYHDACFTCTDCGEPIEDEVFHSNPFRCQACFTHQCPTCVNCGKKILDQKVTMVRGEPYHASCFTCSDCSRPIVDKVFHANPFRCQDCFRRQCPTCARCGRKIEDTVQELDNQFYHVSCLTCDLCQKPIHGRVVKEDGFLLCASSGCCERFRRNKTGGRGRQPPVSTNAPPQRSTTDLVCDFEAAVQSANAIRQVFQQFDKDCNGVISRSELGNVLKMLRTPEAEIEKLMNIIDVNSDGIIDYREFVDWLTHDGAGAHEILTK